MAVRSNASLAIVRSDSNSQSALWRVPVVLMARAQPDLFQSQPAWPDGLRYRAEVLTIAEEQALVAEIRTLPFKPFEFRGYLGRRRVVSFGWRYDYNASVLRQAAPVPDFLKPLRARAAGLAGLAPEAFEQALVTEYAPGAGIGWHRDRPQFAEVAGVSLLSQCVLRFRRRRGEAWERRSLLAEPRSAYLLTGPARSEWAHSISAVEQLRYSVTFRRRTG